MCQAVTFSLGAHKLLDKNLQIQQDIIHLVGGQDEFGNYLKTVDEFNIKDMCVFEADWKLQLDLSGFSAV